jgi:glycine/D-amino acid oxidase-like deaminating enzyme
MAELFRKHPDVTVIGGGSLGINIAYALYQAGVEKTRLISPNLGGQYRSSREGYRLLQADETHAWMVAQTLPTYDALGESASQRAGRRIKTRVQRPYVLLVADRTKDRPDRRTLEEYRRLDRQVHDWGFNPQMEVLTGDSIRDVYPVIDRIGQEGITDAVVINNAGRLYLNNAAREMQAQSQGKVEFVRGRAEEILFDSSDRVTGVRVGEETIPTGHVVVAPGAFVSQLPQLIPSHRADLENLTGRVIVTQRELYAGKIPDDFGIQEDTFLFFPDHADVLFVRGSHGETIASYEYQFFDESHVPNPVENPTTDIARRRKHPFKEDEVSVPEVIFDLLSTGISRYSDEDLRGSLSPTRVTSGYFATYTDNVTRFLDPGPVVDFIPGVERASFAGVTDVSGVQCGRGYGLIAADLVMGTTKTPEHIRNAVKWERERFPEFHL